MSGKHELDHDFERMDTARYPMHYVCALTQPSIKLVSHCKARLSVVFHQGLMGLFCIPSVVSACKNESTNGPSTRLSTHYSTLIGRVTITVMLCHHTTK